MFGDDSSRQATVDALTQSAHKNTLAGVSGLVRGSPQPARVRLSAHVPRVLGLLSQSEAYYYITRHIYI